ncbi:hypothetical protein Q2K19_12875 [Micromonospora soli]|uniref:hypothetical protein n=1 Tax=Micromonospora sp. NBRC 110009 TaxID=3061627 RepID=UPI00267211C4|nr:hypothetical protein [Micromonospora sp. NBRC 110009]WKU01291.1 hypothetical protein Q2K19_12875 [Micromonospora sp. NBRC 110009]
MPAPVAPAEKRTSLLTVLFWIGVGLAPLAALILLVADGNGLLRFGAVLAILAVVLIGLSVALRPDGGGAAAGADELRDEIEQLRRELRSEIVAAAQRGNQALDQAQRTEDSVATLRRRLDAAAAAAAGIAAASADEPAGGRARVPAAETYDDKPSRYGAPEPAAPTWGQAAGRDEDESTRRPQSGARYGTDRAGSAADRPQPGVYGAPRAPEPDGWSEPGPRQVGVVHHTETVHVTTRHTIVDGGAEAGTRYGGYAGRWSPQEERGFAGAEPDERARSEYREAEDDRSGGGRGWAGQGGPREDWAGQGASREDRDWSRAAGSRDDADGGPVRDHPWAGAGRAGGSAGSGDDRGWSAGQGGDRAWSADQPGDQRSWSGASGGASDERSWEQGHAGSPDAWSAGRDGSRDGRGWVASRDEDGPAGSRDGRGWAGQGGGWTSSGARGSAPSEPAARAADDTDGDYWSELRAGNRWASVRDDDRGREIRVGERRAAVHADDGGAEYRVEDRWASVREPRRDQGGVYGGGAADALPGWADDSRPALPAGGVPVPDEWRPPRQRSGQPEWRQAEPEPVRYGDERYGYPPRDDVPRAGGTRPADRWR